MLDHILQCRTAALGGHLFVCDRCDVRIPVYSSCDDRHCPQCGAGRAAEWVSARTQRMLPIPHFQVVFTLPAELRPLCRSNPRQLYTHLLRAAAAVLKDRIADVHGVTVGVTAVLHTWASNLSFHPHVHCLVSAGGLDADDRWTPIDRDVLLDVRHLGACFRGAMLKRIIADLHADRLRLPDHPYAREDLDHTLRRLAKRHGRWNVFVEPPNGRDHAAALKYLARYVHRVAIHDARILRVDARTVTFRVRNRAGHARPLTLDGHEFVRRFLLHVLPHAFTKVRHTGLYAPGSTVRRLAHAHAALQSVLPKTPPKPTKPTDDDILDTALSFDAWVVATTSDIRPAPPPLPCPRCGGPLSCVQLRPPHARGPP